MNAADTRGPRAPYGRRSEEREWAERRDDPHAAAAAEDYYGLPAMKASHYGWLIATYFFVGGLAGGAQLIASVAGLVGGEEDHAVVRAGRYLALAGALLSAPLLIADLHTPRRWYTMLRIVRPTSPMSIGSWTLSLFGTSGALLAGRQGLQDRAVGAGRPAPDASRGSLPGPASAQPARAEAASRQHTAEAITALPLIGLLQPLSRLAVLPAALSGAVMSVYTGVLLEATSVPLWSSAAPLLGPLFGSSAVSTAAAALSLLLGLGGAGSGARQRLTRLGMLSGAAEFGLALAIGRRWRQRLLSPLPGRTFQSAYYGGVLGLATGLPLLLHAVHLAAPRRTRPLPLLAAVSTLAGGYLMRALLVFAGNASARRPQEYLHATRSPNGAATMGSQP